MDIEGRSRVLLLGSSSAIADSGLCTDLLVSERPAEQRALRISYDRTPATVVDDWQRQVEELPAALAVVCPESLAGGSEPLPDGVHTTGVAADDLTGLGIAVSRYLDRWEGTGGPTTACIDSLTSILEHADSERVFRFLHTVTGRFMAAGASGHVHLDPSAVDTQTITTLRTLFDVVVERSGEEWTVVES